MTGRFVLATVLLAVGALSAQAQSVKVEFLMGKVNVVAQNAPLRAILTEWSRVGGTRLINPERLTGGPVTLELAGVPERQALEILLRDVGGYMLGPRAALVPGVSAFDRLIVVAATAGRGALPAPAFPQARPTPQIGRALPPPPPPIQDEDDEDDEDEDDDADEDEQDEDDDGPVAPAIPAAGRTRPVGPGLQPGLPPLPDAQAQPQLPSPTPRTAPGNPFGGIQGSTTPGTVTQPSQPRPGESESERILREQQNGR